MIKIGICDDNATLLQKYSKVIAEYCFKKGLEVELKTYLDGSEVVRDYEGNKDCFDILFLDILMSELNGVETARQLREMKSKAIIIFLTSSEEFVFDAMDTASLAYLMKDQMTSEAIGEVLQNAVDKVEKRGSDSLHFEKDGGTYTLSYVDICFIKVYKGFAYIHHWDGIIFESRDVDALQTLGKDFFQVHEQYIINLHYIAKIEGDCIMLSDESHNSIPLEKQYAKELKLRFAQTMMEKM